MALPAVGNHVILQELQRLRLDRMGEPADEGDEHSHAGLLLDVARRAAEFNGSEGPKDSRRTKLSRARQLLMFGYYVALAEMGRARIVEVLGGGDSMLYDLEHDMKAIGMPAIGTTSPQPHQRLQVFMKDVRRQLPQDVVRLPELGDEPCGLGWVTEAPWVSRVIDCEAGGMFVEDYNDVEPTAETE